VEHPTLVLNCLEELAAFLKDDKGVKANLTRDSHAYLSVFSFVDA
jgi:hypothetical protein